MTDNRVMVFVRPAEHPITTFEDKNIRISYGNSWVDFRNGKVVVTQDPGTVDVKKPCPECAFYARGYNYEFCPWCGSQLHATD